MLICIFEKELINKDALLKLKASNHQLVYSDRYQDSANKVEAVLVRTYTKVDKTFLSKFRNLKYVLKVGVGLDNIEVDETKKRGIRVINAPGSNANSVAEFALALIIMALRNFRVLQKGLESEKWRQRQFMGVELKGKTVGLLGCGAIASILAKNLKMLGVGKIVGYDPYLSYKKLEERGIEKKELTDVLKKSDVISLHLPLTADTKGIIGKIELEAMKKSTVIINTARGEIIDEAELIKALKKGRIAGAALDVFANEPNVNPELIKLNNVIATPHMAAFTSEADYNMAIGVVEEFLRIIKR